MAPTGFDSLSTSFFHPNSDLSDFVARRRHRKNPSTGQCGKNRREIGPMHVFFGLRGLWSHMNHFQFRLRSQRDFQRMGKSHLAGWGKIGGMKNSRRGPFFFDCPLRHLTSSIWPRWFLLFYA